MWASSRLHLPSPHETAKQDPGVQDGSFGRAHRAGDAIAGPMPPIASKPIKKLAPLRLRAVVLG